MATVHERFQTIVQWWRRITEPRIARTLVVGMILPVRLIWQEPAMPVHMNDHEPFIRTMIEYQVDDGLVFPLATLDSYGIFPGTMREMVVQLNNYKPEIWHEVRFKLYFKASDGCRIGTAEETLYLNPHMMPDFAEQMEIFIRSY